MYPSRADSVIIENHLPGLDPSIPDVQAKGHSNSTKSTKSSEIIRKPIAGERESEIVLSRFQTKIGKNFLLENFLPSKQQIPSTIEGKSKYQMNINSNSNSLTKNSNKNFKLQNTQHSPHDYKYPRIPRLVYTIFKIRPPAESTDTV
jgi:hypothetical protein